MSRSDSIINIIEAIKLGGLGVDPHGSFRSSIQNDDDLLDLSMDDDSPQSLHDRLIVLGARKATIGLSYYYYWPQGDRKFVLVGEPRSLAIYMGPHGMTVSQSGDVAGEMVCAVCMHVNDGLEEFYDLVKNIKSNSSKLNYKMLISIRFATRWQGCDDDETHLEIARYVKG